MTQPSEDIVNKIRSILRKADESQNPSDAERDTAMRMANRLLLKHGLAMSDLGEAAEEERSWEHEGFFSTGGDSDAWKGDLLWRISSVYFCKYYRINYGRGAGRHVLLGRVENVAACKAMYEFVAPQLQLEFNVAVSKMTQQHRFARRYAHALMSELLAFDREGLFGEATRASDFDDDMLASIAYDYLEGGGFDDGGLDAKIEDIRFRCEIESFHYAKKVRSKIRAQEIAPSDTENLGVWRRSFFEAAAVRVKMRLHELMDAEVEELGDPGMALVRDETADLKRFVDSLDLGLRSGSSNRESDAAGMDAGREAGDRADLSGHRKVSNGGRKELNA